MAVAFFCFCFSFCDRVRNLAICCNLKTISSVVQVFDPLSERWTDLPPMKARRTGVAVASGPEGRLYAIGELSHTKYGVVCWGRGCRNGRP